MPRKPGMTRDDLFKVPVMMKCLCPVNHPEIDLLKNMIFLQVIVKNIHLVEYMIESKSRTAKLWAYESGSF